MKSPVLTGAAATVFAAGMVLVLLRSGAAFAQPAAPAAKMFALETSFQAHPVADVPSRYRRRGYAEREEAGKFEFFDVDSLAGMVGGAIGAGIADQRRNEYYRQDFFYGGAPYYGRPYYGGPAYYGGIYAPYYYREPRR